jgi:hypothetical protein
MANIKSRLEKLEAKQGSNMEAPRVIVVCAPDQPAVGFTMNGIDYYTNDGESVDEAIDRITATMPDNETRVVFLLSERPST